MAGRIVNQDRYSRIIERIFESRHQEGSLEVLFEREDLERVADELGIKLPKNLGDVIYSFRFRRALPEAIRAKAPEGREWVIRAAGRSRYRFVATIPVTISPNRLIGEIKVPDGTPGIVSAYALSDEQALLARLRYNRLIDIFTGVTCYSLQNHLRTTVPGIGQVESNEIYVGIDMRGVHYVFPVQAKGGKDVLNIVQLEQDLALCTHRFSRLECHPIGAQFMDDDVIALFAFADGENGLTLISEKHYKLVPHEDITNADLVQYGHNDSASTSDIVRQ